MFLEWLKTGGVDALDRKSRKAAANKSKVLIRMKRNGINTNNGYADRPSPLLVRQRHLPRTNMPVQQLTPYSSQGAGYPRSRIHESEVFTSSIFI